ncbi:phosphotransferase [Kibdelosporangium persicum]|uniref:Phosphotransferase family enzyme n=1 Tax=Kibdelosporangium persicum TaxID=2698649 RepID=A0ABX2FD77_9PSEU|nr:phosphotransferase [Kibdelosporangium persicum]NRN68867.1 Phosphotransferase family enzyme [Kibdelosporangium persicum]
MTSAEVWTTAAWREVVQAWVDERLAEASIRRIGDLTQPRVRPWGTVLTAPTSQGVIWVKAPGPQTVFEVALYEVLRDVAPEWVLEPIAIDVQRGWLVLPDGGTAVRESTADPVESMMKILPQYGELQRRLSPHVDRLLAAGVADMRAETVPRRFDEAVDAVRARPHDKALVERIVDRRDLVVERAGQLTIAPSLDHNDLHLGNVFLRGDRAVFYDWGDSVVSHPFASMLVAIGHNADQAVVARLRDSYLEAFTDLAPRRELAEQIDLACWIGMIARTLVWDRALGAGPAPEKWATASLETLSGLLDGNWLKVAQ